MLRKWKQFDELESRSEEAAGKERGQVTNSGPGHAVFCGLGHSYAKTLKRLFIYIYMYLYICIHIYIMYYRYNLHIVLI